MGNMKKILQLSFFIVISSLFSTYTYSCNALDVSVGTSATQAAETLDFIDIEEDIVVEDEEDELRTLQYQANTNDYCPDVGLENTKLYVFVYKSKVAGIRVETWDPNKDKNKIYQFVKNNFGDVGSEVEKENWLGYKEIDQGSILILYSKHKISDEIYESLDISSEEFIEHTYGESVILVN